MEDRLYQIMFDDNLYSSVYGRVLQQRKIWQLSRAQNGASVILSKEMLSHDVYRKCAINQTMFNHLPGSQVLLNPLKLFMQLRYKYGKKVYDHFRLTYSLGTEKQKFISHIQYLAD